MPAKGFEIITKGAKENLREGDWLIIRPTLVIFVPLVFKIIYAQPLLPLRQRRIRYHA